MGWVWMGFVFAGVAVGCDCGYLPACERYPQTEVVFTGKVLSGNDNGSGLYVQQTRYLVRVLEAIRGLPVAQTEVFIDPGSFGSCYRHFAIGETYLFYAGRGASLPNTLSRAAGLVSKKPVPAAWADKQGLPVYVSDNCSGSQPLDRAQADLMWIRLVAGGETRRFLYGTTYQLSPPVFNGAVPIPLSGVRVQASGPEGTFSAVSGLDGTYTLPDVPAGKYRLSVERPPWNPPAAQSVELGPGRCVEQSFGLRSHGVLEGTVWHADGSPGKDVRVEIVRVQADGSPGLSTVAAATADAAGRFRMTDVPAGRFYAGVNLTAAMTPEQPWPATYLPGTDDWRRAHVLDLEPNGNVNDLELVVAPPRPVRNVDVRVFWADGEPATAVRIHATPLDAPEHLVPPSLKPPKLGGQLRLMQDYSYEITADWYMRREYWEVETSDPVTLPRGKTDAVVEVRFRSKAPTGGK